MPGFSFLCLVYSLPPPLLSGQESSELLSMTFCCCSGGGGRREDRGQEVVDIQDTRDFESDQHASLQETFHVQNCIHNELILHFELHSFIFKNIHFLMPIYDNVNSVLLNFSLVKLTNKETLGHIWGLIYNILEIIF